MYLVLSRHELGYLQYSRLDVFLEILIRQEEDIRVVFMVVPRSQMVEVVTKVDLLFHEKLKEVVKCYIIEVVAMHVLRLVVERDTHILGLHKDKLIMAKV